MRFSWLLIYTIWYISFDKGLLHSYNVSQVWGLVVDLVHSLVKAGYKENVCAYRFDRFNIAKYYFVSNIPKDCHSLFDRTWLYSACEVCCNLSLWQLINRSAKQQITKFTVLECNCFYDDRDIGWVVMVFTWFAAWKLCF